jgi:hypothetical protein
MYRAHEQIPSGKRRKDLLTPRFHPPTTIDPNFACLHCCTQELHDNDGVSARSDCRRATELQEEAATEPINKESQSQQVRAFIAGSLHSPIITSGDLCDPLRN